MQTISVPCWLERLTLHDRFEGVASNVDTETKLAAFHSHRSVSIFEAENISARWRLWHNSSGNTEARRRQLESEKARMAVQSEFWRHQDRLELQFLPRC